MSTLAVKDIECRGCWMFLGRHEAVKGLIHAQIDDMRAPNYFVADHEETLDNVWVSLRCYQCPHCAYVLEYVDKLKDKREEYYASVR